MDTEQFMMAYFDTPDFVHQGNELLSALCEYALNTALPHFVPVIDGGGYQLSCDHIVPHNVPFENYCYLVELLKVHFGIQ